MSRKQRLVVVILALGNVIVLAALVFLALASLRAPAAPVPVQTPIPTSTSRPTDASFPTWTPTSEPVLLPTRTPRPTSTPAPPTETPAPWPTLPQPSPTPAAGSLENPTFDGIAENAIPGWQTGAFVNWAVGDDFDAGTSYAAPRFHQADDPRQWIEGSTLQIDTEQWVKLRAWVFQSLSVQPGSRVVFDARGAAILSDASGGYLLKVGVDPAGGEGCDAAQWGEVRQINQGDGIVPLVSPEVVVGEEGRVTVCLFAETQYAQVWHAAFFDDAALTVLPPESP